MGFYDRHIMPRLIDTLCAMSAISEQRKRVVPSAEGIVLEVGIGSGLNLPFYDPIRVTKLIGIDPDDGMWSRSAKRRGQCRFPIERIGLGGEGIPLANGTVDTALITYAMCSIPEPVAVLREMRRVLKPGRRLLFLEHGMAPDDSVRKWQRRIDPIWTRIAGGCHSGRPILRYIKDAGWRTDRLGQGYIKGPKTLAYNYWGSAEAA